MVIIIISLILNPNIARSYHLLLFIVLSKIFVEYSFFPRIEVMQHSPGFEYFSFLDMLKWNLFCGWKATLTNRHGKSLKNSRFIKKPLEVIIIERTEL